MAQRPNNGSKPHGSDSTLEHTKQRLCEQFSVYLKKHDLSQRQLADLLETDESVVSKILRYKTDEFTTDFLVKKLNTIYSKLEVTIQARE